MTRKRYSDEDVLKLLREIELKLAAGDDVAGWMRVPGARRLRAFKDENAKVKKMLAEQMQDNAMLRDVASKNW